MAGQSPVLVVVLVNTNFPRQHSKLFNSDNAIPVKKDTMPNFASLFKAEIARISRKEIRVETERLQGMVAQGRKDISALKQQVATLEKLVKKAAVSAGKSRPSPTPGDQSVETKIRFSPARLKAFREKMELTANELAGMAGVSGQSIYKWEAKKAYPRAKQLVVLDALMKLSKSAIAARSSKD